MIGALFVALLGTACGQTGGGDNVHRPIDGTRDAAHDAAPRDAVSDVPLEPEDAGLDARLPLPPPPRPVDVEFCDSDRYAIVADIGGSLYVSDLFADSSHVYFAASATSSMGANPIYRVPLCGGGIELVAPDAGSDAAVEDAGPYLYACSWTKAVRVRKSDLDAEDVTASLEESCRLFGGNEAHAYFTCPTAIVRLDHAETVTEVVVPGPPGGIYQAAAEGEGGIAWSEGGFGWDTGGIIFFAGHDGNEVRELGEFGTGPSSLAVTRDHVYAGFALGCIAPSCARPGSLIRISLDTLAIEEASPAALNPLSLEPLLGGATYYDVAAFRWYRADGEVRTILMEDENGREESLLTAAIGVQTSRVYFRQAIGGRAHLASRRVVLEE